jgi:hypothetical protein
MPLLAPVTNAIALSMALSLPARRAPIQGQSIPGTEAADGGPLRIECDVLTIPEDDQQVVFMTAEPGTASARALRHLALTGS